MYPFFEIYNGFLIYTFGLTLSVCFFIFIWMLRKLSTRFGYDFNVFRDNLLWFFIGIFFFSRLFYVFAKWDTLGYIRDPFEFFIMSDYNFSLFWAIAWFFVILFLCLKFSKEQLLKYIDGVVLSFLFVAIIGYVWTLFWGEVYGRETHIGIEILYTHPFTPVPFEVPIFPLPIVYAILTFILFCSLYMLSLFVHIKWFIGYVGLVAFSSFILIFESLSGKNDILKSHASFNLNQVYALLIIGYVGYELYKLLQINTGSKKVTIIK